MHPVQYARFHTSLLMCCAPFLLMCCVQVRVVGEAALIARCLALSNSPATVLKAVGVLSPHLPSHHHNVMLYHDAMLFSLLRVEQSTCLGLVRVEHA